MAPAKRTTKAPATKRLSRLHSMAFGTAAYVSRRRLPFAAQDSLPGAGQALLDRLFTCKVPLKGFQLTSCVSSSFPKLLGTIAFSRLRDLLSCSASTPRSRQEKREWVGDGGPALAVARWSHPTRSPRPPSGFVTRRLTPPARSAPSSFTCSPVLLLSCSSTPREALPLWKNWHVVTQREYTPVFPSFLRVCTMKTPNTPDNNSPEAIRLERVWLYIKLHCPRIMPLLDVGDVLSGLSWRQIPGLEPS